MKSEHIYLIEIVIDTILQDANIEKAFFVILDQYELTRNKIVQDLNLAGKNMILVVYNRRELTFFAGSC